jgi:tetratricopeptide (TPR) repeat protein
MPDRHGRPSRGLLRQGLRTIKSFFSHLGNVPSLVGYWFSEHLGRPMRHGAGKVGSLFGMLAEIPRSLGRSLDPFVFRPLRHGTRKVVGWLEPIVTWPARLLATVMQPIGRALRHGWAKVEKATAPIVLVFSSMGQKIGSAVRHFFRALGRVLRPVFVPLAALAYALSQWLNRRFGWFFRWCGRVLRPILIPFQVAVSALNSWMGRQYKKLSRVNLKRVLLVTGIVAVVLGALGYWQGRPLYRKHKERNFLAMARLFMGKGEDMKAVICARNVLFYNPTSSAACEILSELADRSKSPQAVVWRSRVVELSPTLENRIKLVDSALRYDTPPYPVASKALDEFPEADRKGVTFHLLSARFALQLRQINRAESHLEDAIRLEPTNALHQLNLAAIRLGSTNAAVAQTARQTLEGLRHHTTVGLEALRNLTSERLSRTNLAEARAYSEELLADPRCVFNDRLLHLAILRTLRSAEEGPFLRKLQSQAVTNAVEIAELANWMLTRGQVQDALEWLRQLPPEVRSRQPVPVTLAACHETAKDWKGLQSFLEKEKWGDQDFLKSALLAKALRNQNEPTVADSYWREAVRLASERAEFLALLAQTARSWGWSAEAMDLLNLLSTRYTAQPWAIHYVFQQHHSMGNTQAMQQVLSGLLNPASTNASLKDTEEALSTISARFASQPWALWLLQHLFDHYLATGNTPGLYQILSTALNRDSESTILKNNLAAVSLLLRTNLTMAHQLASQAYQREPANPIIASTYGYSLHVQGKTVEAVAVMEKLSASDLRKPALAVYYGCFLASAGQTAKARDYLALAESPTLLPEEKALVMEARRKVGLPTAGP